MIAPGNANAETDGAKLLSWANEMVDAYASLLQSAEAGVWIPERDLPASVPGIKQALVIAAADKLTRRLIAEGELDVYRSGYVLLGSVVVGDDARAAQDLTTATNAWRTSTSQSDDELGQLLDKFAMHSSLFQRDLPSEVDLMREFDDRLLKLIERHTLVIWCWRCRADMPMLDEVGFGRITAAHKSALDSLSTQSGAPDASSAAVFAPVLNAYEGLTGYREANPAAVWHHRLALCGPPCRTCGKPLRTPQARFCAACGAHRRADRRA